MKKLQKNTKALFLLWFLILFSCLFIFRHFLFGSEFPLFRDMGSDTIEQYLMQFNSIINAMKDQNLSLWDFTNGFGTSLYALNLFHPFLFVLYLLGTLTHPMYIPYLLVFFQIGQMLLAATVFFFYLKEFPISVKSRVITSYLYGLNGYLLVWGQHYQFGFWVILFPFLLLLAERSLKKRTFSIPLTLAVSVSVLSSIYMSYMVLLGLGFYLLFRIFSSEESFSAQMRLFLLNCGSILLGLGMMMAVFLPSAHYLFSISSRLDNETSLFQRILENLAPYDFSFYKLAFSRLFSSNLYGTARNYTGIINYYEDPVLFSGLLFIILFPQYLFTIHRQDTSRNQKAAQYFAVLLICFFTMTQIGSMIFNAFTYAFSRHTFLLMSFNALLCAFTLDQIFLKKRISYVGFGCTAVLFALLFLLRYETFLNSVLFLCMLGFLMSILLLLAYQKRWKLSSRVLAFLLLVLVMINMTFDSFIDYNNRDTLRKEDTTYFKELYGEDITEALDYLKETDHSFYRVEKDYDAGSYCMDALTQNYFGVSTYNSTPNKNIREFITRFWPGLERLFPSMYSYRQTVHDAEMASLVNIKYLLSHDPALNVDGFSLLKQFGSVYIYQNQNTSSIGKFFSDEQIMSGNEFPEVLSSVDVDRLLNDYLILDNTGTASSNILEDYSYKKQKSSVKKQTFKEQQSVVIPVDTSVHKDHQRVYMEFTVSLNSSAVLFASSSPYCRYYFSCEEAVPVTIRLRLPQNCDSITLSGTMEQPLTGVVKNVTYYKAPAISSPSSNAVIDFSMPEKDTTVTGTIKADTDGFLMVTIPYEDGWSVSVDGQKAELLRADYGFQAVRVTSGSHELSFRYQPPGLQTGFLLSLVCFGIFLLILLLKHRAGKRNSNKTL